MSQVLPALGILEVDREEAAQVGSFSCRFQSPRGALFKPGHFEPCGLQQQNSPGSISGPLEGSLWLLHCHPSGEGLGVFGFFNGY